MQFTETLFGKFILLLSEVLKQNYKKLLVCLCWGLMTCQPLRVILCRLPEERRKEVEETAEMKERDRRESRK